MISFFIGGALVVFYSIISKTPSNPLSILFSNPELGFLGFHNLQGLEEVDVGDSSDNVNIWLPGYLKEDANLKKLMEKFPNLNYQWIPFNQ